MKKLFSYAAFAITAASLPVRADVEDRLYDFTDAYYLKNGINPAAIDGRRQPGPLAATDTPTFSFQRPVRALLTLPAYDHSGHVEFFTVVGGFSNNAFTADAAGRKARKIANSSPEFIFPRAGTDPLGLGAMRQSVLLDMRKGYFSNNKLGLWIHVWVSYTSKAFETAGGREMLAELAEDNGQDLDGTPIIAKRSEIAKLAKKGYVTLKMRPLDDPLRYAVCPVIKDPRDGGIATDQFLAITRKDDGSALEPEFEEEFESLRTTGRESD